MAEGARIGALHFALGADTAELEAALGKASKSLKGAERAGQVAGNVIVGALVGIGGAVAGAFAVDRIISFSTEAIAAAAAIGRFAAQAGLTAQEFQGLDHALRDARVPQEQLAQGFAIFSRNLSDLHRNTGPFLDFIRRFAPHLEAQFKAARSTAEAFGVLTDAVNTLGNEQDRVRLLNAAGAEQFGRLASTMLQGRTAIDEASRAYRGLSDAERRSAEDLQRRWDELWRTWTLRGQRAIIAVSDSFKDLGSGGDPARLEGLSASIARINEQLGRLTAPASTAQIAQQTAALRAYRDAWAALTRDTAHMDFPAPPPTTPRPTGLTPDQIKAAQGELARFMAQLQQLPPQADFISSNFAAAWGRMAAVMRAQNESEGAIAAARINLLRQEDAARQQVLGTAITAMETLQRRQLEIFTARANQLITEAEMQRALQQAEFQFHESQLMTAQGLGATISVNDQYALSIERIRQAYDNGRISADQFRAASQMAAMNVAATYASAASQITGSLAGAWQKSKGFAIANAIASALAGATRAYMDVPYPLNIGVSAAILAAGMKNVANIRSTNPNSSPSVGGGSGAAVGGGGGQPATPMQMLQLNLSPGRYSRDEVAGLIEQINAAQADGVRLVTTVNNR